ncbi:MAG TPA: class I SAM-dependent methyltransferase [Candidatus Bathyarchaeia archaeon]|nr:class I SAM-dependent methyltransferase [Candidatus Bathyarchaeia archaeon]
MTDSSYKDWNLVYREYPAEVLPWELGRPRKTLVDLIESGTVKLGKSLDLCCGTGTNTVYMAEKGFQAVAIDISKHALKLAKQKSRKARVDIQFALASFVTLPFKEAAFDFVFDMGCFHHVEIEDRKEFIRGICQVLKPKAHYQLTCFSDRNGVAWNHFTKERLARYFAGRFRFISLDHFGSVEGNGSTRFFYSILMQRREKPCT